MHVRHELQQFVKPVAERNDHGEPVFAPRGVVGAVGAVTGTRGPGGGAGDGRRAAVGQTRRQPHRVEEESDDSDDEDDRGRTRPPLASPSHAQHRTETKKTITSVFQLSWEKGRVQKKLGTI